MRYSARYFCKSVNLILTFIEKFCLGFRDKLCMYSTSTVTVPLLEMI